MKTNRPTTAPKNLSFGARKIKVGDTTHEMVVQKRTYKVITPIFGGGIEKGKPDSTLPVNAKMVRGQLRFWWRVMRAGGFETVAALHKTESTMWGAAASEDREKVSIGHSKIHVAVKVTKVGQNLTVYGDDDKLLAQWGDLGYFLFPLQPDSKKGILAGNICRGVSFELEIAFPAVYRAAIEAALWAWETFGGVGGRTRRGFGALRLVSLSEDEVAQEVKLPGSAIEAELDIRQRLKDPAQLKVGNRPYGVPKLTNLLVKFENNTVDAGIPIQRTLAGHYKKFRQNRTREDRGRQNWPEADAIRELEHTNAVGYDPLPNNCGKFPRGQFGLPIVFHFKDSGAGDPSDFSLQPPDAERLASPLILKPLACQGNLCVGLIVRLAAQFPESMPNLEAVLKPLGHRSSTHDVFLSVTQPDVTGNANLSGIKPMQNPLTPDAVHAFFEHLKNLP